MSKVRVSFEIDLPEYVPNQELTQIVFDAITNYACVKHGMDAMNWMVKSAETDYDKTHNYDMLVTYHKTWQKILFDVQIEVDPL